MCICAPYDNYILSLTVEFTFLCLNFREWDKELKKLKEGKQPSLIKATIRGFGLRYALNGLFTVVEVSCKLFSHFTIVKINQFL